MISCDTSGYAFHTHFMAMYEMLNNANNICAALCMILSDIYYNSMTMNKLHSYS